MKPGNDAAKLSNQSKARRTPHEIVAVMSDEELFDAIREQVNKSRNDKRGHDRAMTQAIGNEMKRRGWRCGKPER